MKLSTIITLNFFAFSVLFTACRKEGCVDQDAINFDAKAKKDDGSCVYEKNIFSIRVVFNNLVDGDLMEKNSMEYIQNSGQKYNVQNLMYFLSEPSFVIDGEEIALPEIHYIDAFVDSTLTWDIPKDFSKGNLQQMAIRFGFRKTVNDTIQITTFPEYNMEWSPSLGGGWHYMKLEGKYTENDTITPNFYNTHFGPTNGNDNSFETQFKIEEIEVKGGSLVTININLDFAQFYKEPIDYKFSDYSGIMGDQNAQSILEQNGHNLMSIESVVVD